MSACCESNSTRDAAWAVFCPTQGNSTGFQNGKPSGIIGRTGFLFIAGAIAIITGLLFPLSAYVLDVLLIFSMSLTMALLIITFSGRGALEVSGFPLLIVLVTMLRMALSVACSRLILSQGNAGTIIGLCGSIFVINNMMLAVLIFGILMMVSFGTICKAVKGISHITADFISDIAPVKQTGIDSDLNTGSINNEQALSRRDKIARETGFFAAMTGAARFILCDAVIEVAIVIVNVVGVAVAGISVKSYITLAVGAGIVAHISALLAAVASGCLVRKASVSAAANDRFSKQTTKRIEVVAREVSPPRAVELRCSIAVSCVKSAEHLDAESGEITNPAAAANIRADEIVIAEDLEWLDKETANENENDNLHLWSWKNAEVSKHYDAIAELMESKSSSESKTILMAAESVENLLVTIPVNIAMRLAQKGRKCILIDLDLERDAVSKVFDIDSKNLECEAIATCISNLWVWPAGNFGESDAININDVIAGLKSRYDRLVVYAPNIKLLDDWEHIADCIQAVMLFGPRDESKSSSISDFYKLLSSSGCAILEPTEIFAGVV